MSHETLFTARWVLPVVSPPLRDGALWVQDGRFVAAGSLSDLQTMIGDVEVRDLGDVILLPGLVNAHTHLSLTALAPHIPRRGPLLEWLATVTREASKMSEDEVRRSVREGLESSWRAGTMAIGEITTRPEGVAEIVADPRFAARVYFEFLGVSPERSERRYKAALDLAMSLVGGSTRPGLSPHAPYSVWPTLWQSAAQFCRDHDVRWSTHLAESPYEREFLLEGHGPLREHLERLGVWDNAFPVPRENIVPFWMSRRVLDDRALLVHGLHVDDSDMDTIAASGAFLCLCPRSNAMLGLPAPRVRDLVERGVPLCLGTDSLASNHDLSVWGEMRAIHELMPELPAEKILRMATWVGADALGLGDRCGSLAPGLPARFLGVEAPDLGDQDPLAYLLRPLIELRVRLFDMTSETADI
jgi:cytosine/adenosine deaminase-related metal-dependent hydrolase